VYLDVQKRTQWHEPLILYTGTLTHKQELNGLSQSSYTHLQSTLTYKQELNGLSRIILKQYLDVVDDLCETASVGQGMGLLEHAVVVEGPRHPVAHTTLYWHFDLFFCFTKMQLLANFKDRQSHENEEAY
jgi:hypothetical protein